MLDDMMPAPPPRAGMGKSARHGTWGALEGGALEGGALEGGMQRCGPAPSSPVGPHPAAGAATLYLRATASLREPSRFPRLGGGRKVCRATRRFLVGVPTKPMARGAALIAVLIAVIAAGPRAAAETDPVEVVATFSLIGDMAAAIGGERVSVATIVGPNGDPHVYQPTPDDARRLAAADLVLANGLGLEGWIARLIAAARSDAPVVTVSDGIAPLTFHRTRAHAAIARYRRCQTGNRLDVACARGPLDYEDTIGTDPHAWHDLANARIYVANIAAALTEADPAGAETYAASLAGYQRRLAALEDTIRTVIRRLPDARRVVITTHDAFGYFERAYGLRFEALQSAIADAEPSAADLAYLIRRIRRMRVPAIFVETTTDRRLIERVARETGTRIGGELYSDALSPPDGPAPTFLDMIGHNIRTIEAALNAGR